MNMFCYQCEQTADETGCTKTGICGKGPTESNLQDLIVHGLKSLGIYGLKARDMGIVDEEVDIQVIEGLFSTVTNVDFDADRLMLTLSKIFEMKKKSKINF